MAKTSNLPRKAKPARVAVHQHPAGATAVQVDAQDGSQLVACDNLRVLITKEDGAWIAQGLEIDYAVDGATVAEVKQRFQHGLSLTIESHLRVNRNIADLLRPAGADIWAAYFAKKNTLRRYTHSLITFLQLQQHLPFDHILWAEEKDEAA